MDMNYTNPKDVRILFFGTPKIAARVLSALLDASFSVAGVVCQEDKKVGRKALLTPPPAKVIATQNGIPCFQPHRLRLDHEFLSAIDYDIIVCIAYGQIIPNDVLQSAPLGAYNLHASLLPKYRGAAPMQRALMDGEKETGVCLMAMVSKMDAGDVFDKLSFPISLSDNYDSVNEKMGEAASSLIVKDLLPLANGALKGKAQNEEKATFANKITPDEEHLPLNMTVLETHNYVRALSETPGSFVVLDGKKCKILETEPLSTNPNFKAGTLFGDGKDLCLALKDGALKIKRIQPEGKKPMSGRDFYNGHREVEGKTVS